MLRLKSQHRYWTQLSVVLISLGVRTTYFIRQTEGSMPPRHPLHPDFISDSASPARTRATRYENNLEKLPRKILRVSLHQITC